MSAFKRMRSLVVLTFSMLAFTACNEIKVEDGILLKKYVPFVTPYLGRYTGTIEGKQTEILIYMQKNSPSIRVKNEFGGGDITGMECRSSVGKLLSFSATDLGNNEYQLDRAIFALDPGSCNIKGRAVTLVFTENSELSLSISGIDNRAEKCSAASADANMEPTVCHKVGEIPFIRGKFVKN